MQLYARLKSSILILYKLPPDPDKVIADINMQLHLQTVACCCLQKLLPHLCWFTKACIRLPRCCPDANGLLASINSRLTNQVKQPTVTLCEAGNV